MRHGMSYSDGKGKGYAGKKSGKKGQGKNPHSAKMTGYVTGQYDKRSDSKDAKRIAKKKV